MKHMNEKASKLAYKMIEHMKLFDLYDYHDDYSSDEEAFDNLYPLYLNQKGIRNQISELAEDITVLATEKDLEDPEMKKIFESAVDLIKDFNKHSLELDKYNDVQNDM